MTDFVHGDVLEWARTYDGEPFHAMLCDPPYHLTDVVASRYGRLSGVDPENRGQTSPPFGNNNRGGFMGKTWDGGDIAFRPETWAALGEHLLPGAFCMAFSGARTYHRMACAIEDAGFVLHSMIGWVYGSGFPKATRLDSQIDRAAGAEQPVVGIRRMGVSSKAREDKSDFRGAITEADRWQPVTEPVTDMARTWAGHRYGLQALKPALEPICVFQKPYAGRPVDSITEYGAGALWVEGGRIEGPMDGTWGARQLSSIGYHGTDITEYRTQQPAGRWPSNLILQHAPGCKRVGVKRVKPTGGRNPCERDCDMLLGQVHNTDTNTGYADADGYETVEEWQCVEGCAAAALGRMSGESTTNPYRPNKTGTLNTGAAYGQGTRKSDWRGPADSGTCARFFQQCDWALEEAEPFYYCAKASRRERDAGLEVWPAQDLDAYSGSMEKLTDQRMSHQQNRLPRHNSHPTVKALSLTKYLATLLLPPAEYAPRRILVPFGGVGSEAIGAALAGWEYVLGIEAEAEYVEMARARAAHWLMQPSMTLEAAS